MSAKTGKTRPADDWVGREFIIRRAFDAPRELVFEAWTDPLHLARWWGPRGFTNPTCTWEARPGSRIHVVMRAPNGADFPMGGEFREVVPPERLSFTSGALDGAGRMLFEFLHVVTFVERAGTTDVTVASRILWTTGEGAAYLGGFEAGMTQSLKRLAGHLPSMRPAGG